MVAFFTTDNQIVIISGVRNVHVGNQCWDNNVPDQGGWTTHKWSTLHGASDGGEGVLSCIRTTCTSGSNYILPKRMHTSVHAFTRTCEQVCVSLHSCGERLQTYPHAHPPPPPPPFKATHMHVIFTKFYSPFPTSPKYQY